MTETGVIKFVTKRLSSIVPPFPELDELNRCRAGLVEAGLLGRDKQGIGFGNISVRRPDEPGFYITPSGSGDRPILSAADIVQVIEWNISKNKIEFRGASDPSSESLTHAAVYESDETVGAIVHAHDSFLWKCLLAAGDATSGAAEYGTPAMAAAVKEFIRTRRGNEILFAMNGHAGGLLCCGHTLESICLRLLTAKK